MKQGWQQPEVKDFRVIIMTQEKTTYHCLYCNKYFGDKQKYENHLKYHESCKGYECPELKDNNNTIEELYRLS